MRRRTRTGRKSKIRRKGKGRKKSSLVKTIKRVARREELRLVETKRNVVLNEDYTYAPTGAYKEQYSYVNIFSAPFLSGGTNQGSYIGTEIVDPLFVARLEMSVDWGLISQDNPATGPLGVVCHAWLIATNDQIAQQTPIPYQNSSLGWFIQQSCYRAQMNGNNVKVLKHYSKILNPPSIPFSATTPAAKPPAYATSVYKHKFVYKFKGKKEFEEDAATAVGKVLRGWNYYFLVGFGVSAYDTLVANSQNVYIRADRYLYFKDP